MSYKLSLPLAAVGLFSLFSFAVPARSEAHDQARRYRNERAAREQRRDWIEYRKDRAELQRDLAELERDRADLRRLYRRGASRAAIDRKKAEIRDDLREIREDRRELRESDNDLWRQDDRDRHYDWSDRWGRRRPAGRGWWGWGNGWWDSGRDRAYRYE